MPIVRIAFELIPSANAKLFRENFRMVGMDLRRFFGCVVICCCKCCCKDSIQGFKGFKTYLWYFTKLQETWIKILFKKSTTKYYYTSALIYEVKKQIDLIRMAKRLIIFIYIFLSARGAASDALQRKGTRIVNPIKNVPAGQTLTDVLLSDPNTW